MCESFIFFFQKITLLVAIKPGWGSLPIDANVHSKCKMRLKVMRPILLKYVLINYKITQTSEGLNKYQIYANKIKILFLFKSVSLSININSFHFQSMFNLILKI